VHVPDGIIATGVWVTLDVVAVGGLGVAVKKVEAQLDERNVPLMGVLGAFIFAAQMLNFPVGFGASGHIVGGVLAAVVLGPFTGAIVISSVLIIQALLFQDGGLTVLGVNILNMGLISTLLGYPIYRGIHRLGGESDRARYAGVFAAGWIAVVLSAVALSIELAVSGVANFTTILLGLVAIHAIIGLFEGVITVAVLRYVQQVRPDILAVHKA
jgi:cobalt/nickel transport system permease protein